MFLFYLHVIFVEFSHEFNLLLYSCSLSVGNIPASELEKVQQQLFLKDRVCVLSSFLFSY